MASKLLRNRIDPKDQKLALEKAAAWAWHQHCSGSEGKTMREFHIARTQRDHRPSRYKLEAMRISSSSSSSQETKEGGSSPVQHTKKFPLLDAYEVRSILTRLDSLIAETSDDKLNDNGGERMMIMKKKKTMVGKGIWERRRARVICSTRKEDVVDGTIQRSAAKLSMPRADINNGGRVM